MIWNWVEKYENITTKTTNFHNSLIFNHLHNLLIFNGLFFVQKFFIDLQHVSILGQKIIHKRLVYIKLSSYLYYVIKNDRYV